MVGGIGNVRSAQDRLAVEGVTAGGAAKVILGGSLGDVPAPALDAGQDVKRRCCVGVYEVDVHCPAENKKLRCVKRSSKEYADLIEKQPNAETRGELDQQTWTLAGPFLVCRVRNLELIDETVR